ncbi:hypothetical protein D3C72_1576050 [compost metagenome]
MSVATTKVVKNRCASSSPAIAAARKLFPVPGSPMRNMPSPAAWRSAHSATKRRAAAAALALAGMASRSARRTPAWTRDGTVLPNLASRAA